MDRGHDAQQVQRRQRDRIHRVGQELHDARHGIVLRGEEAAEDGGHERGGGALLQAVPIQNAQQAAMARPAAAADSSAMPWSRCSGRRCASRWRGASRGAVQPGADLAPQRQAFVIAVDQLAQPGHQAGQQRVAPAGAAVDGRRQPDGGRAQPQRGGMGGARTGVDPFGNAGQQARDVLGQRLAVGLQGAHAVLDGRDNGRQRRDAVLHGAHRAGGPAQVAGVERHVGRQQAQLGDVVGQGAAVLSDLPASPPARMSCIQSRASRTALSSSSVSAGARPRGSTTLWTSVAQTMPSAISSTRASAVSNTSVGSETDGNRSWRRCSRPA